MQTGFVKRFSVWNKQNLHFIHICFCRRLTYREKCSIIKFKCKALELCKFRWKRNLHWESGKKSLDAVRLNFAGFRLRRNLHWESGKKSLGAVRLNSAGFRRRYNSALKQCGTKGSAFVRFGALCCAGSPPPVRRASLQAARRVGAPRPEAQPARARPQAGARRCAAPEGQGEAAQACYGGAGKQRAGAPNRRNRDKVLVRYAGAERKAERRFLARAAEVVLCGATAQSGKRQAVCRNG